MKEGQKGTIRTRPVNRQKNKKSVRQLHETWKLIKLVPAVISATGDKNSDA